MVNGRPLAVEVALAHGAAATVLVVNDVDAAPVAALGATVQQARSCFGLVLTAELRAGGGPQPCPSACV